MTDGVPVDLPAPRTVESAPPTLTEIASGAAFGYAYIHGARVITLISPDEPMPRVRGRGWWALPSEYLPRGMWSYNPDPYYSGRTLREVEPGCLGMWFSPDENPNEPYTP